MVQIEAVVIVEKLRQVEEIEPPDRVGKTLAKEERPEASMAQQGRVDGTALGNGGKIDLGLRCAAAKLVVRKDQPDAEPDQAHGASTDERSMPAEAQSNGRDEQGRYEGRCVRTGVEEAGSEGALFRWEPLCRGLDGRGEVAGLAEAEQRAADHEAHNAADQRSAD